MPREQLVISQFTTGLIASPDAQDIGDDAAAYSLNVDPETSPGVLRGRKSDRTISTYPPVALQYGSFLERDDGTRDLLYFNGAGLQHQTWSATAPTAAVSSGETNANITHIQPSTREVRCGVSTGGVRWAGFISDEQFGDAGSDSTLVVSNARLENPTGTPAFEHVVSTGTKLYCCTIGGDKIYVISIATGDVEATVEGFTNLRGICKSYLNPTATLYVLDGSTLQQMAMADNSLGTGYSIGTLTGILSGSEITDIECISDGGGTPKDRIFMALQNDTCYAPGDTAATQYAWVFSVDWTGSTLTNTDRTPKLVPNVVPSSNPGWMAITYDEDESPAGASAAYFAMPNTLGLVAQTFNKSLIKFNDQTPTYGANGSSIGWVFRTLPTTVVTHSLGVKKIYPVYRESAGAPSTANFQYGGLVMMCILRGATSNPNTGFTCILPNHKTPMEFNGGAVYIDADPDYQLCFSRSAYVERHNIPDPRDLTSAEGDESPGKVAGTLYPTEVGVTDWHARSASEWVISAFNGYSGISDQVEEFTTDVDPATNVIYEGGSAVLTITAGFANSEWTQNRRHFYRVSYTYDAVQESPLSLGHWKVTNGGSPTDWNITVRVQETGSLSRRVTHLNVYRASGAATALEPDGYYRLVKSIPLTNRYFSFINEGYEHQFYDTVESTGASYEARTGCSSTAEDNFVDWEISTLLNGYLFVTRARHEDLPDANHMVFRSKALRYDTFNWSEDYVRLPEVPMAISSFGGRLLAFSPTGVYRIDPENLIIEDFFPGAGALDQRGVVQTDMGVWFCDTNNVYFTDGNGVQHIGAPIRQSLESDGYSWQGAGHTYFNPKAVYSSALKQVHFVTSYNSSKDVISFCYHVPTKRWDAWQLPDVITGSEDNSGLITDREGNLYWSVNTAAYEVAGHLTQRSAWEWRSKILTLGTPSQVKRFYGLDVDAIGMTVSGGAWKLPSSFGIGNGSLTVEGRVDDWIWTEVWDVVGGVYQIPDWTPGFALERGRRIQFKVYAPASTTEDVVVRNLTLLFRRMVGMR